MFESATQHKARQERGRGEIYEQVEFSYKGVEISKQISQRKLPNRIFRVEIPEWKFPSGIFRAGFSERNFPNEIFQGIFHYLRVSIYEKGIFQVLQIMLL